MAVKKEIEIEVNSQSADANLNDLLKTLNGINDNFKKVGEDGKKSLANIEKGVKNTEKSTKSLAQGFKGAGLALKAMGVGLLLSALEVLKGLFQSNQKVADFFGTTLKSLSIVFNDLFNFITDNFDSVKSFFKAIFEDPIGSLEKLGQLIKENIIERFTSALEVAGFLSDALVKLFKGDFEGALDSVKEAGKEMIDVLTGVDDTFGKVGELADQVGKYATEVWNSAEALQAQENNAKLAAAQQARLVEQYDRQAEKLRQIRDNDLISIDERIKANDELGKVLEKQEKAMLAQADAQIMAVKNQLALNNSIENQVALIDALANREGILAQIEGFRSEQLVNQQSLQKELIELANTKLEAETTLANQQSMFEASRRKDIETRLQLERESLEREKQTELERLQIKIDSYAQGTQARLDAEIEFASRKQEIENNITAKEDELAQFRFDRNKTALEETFNNENESFALRLQALQAYNQMVQDSEFATEEEKRKAQQQTLEQEKIIQAQRLALTANTLGNIATLLGNNSKAGKAFAVAQSLINTYQGVTAELATKTATPFEFGLKVANIATTVAIGMKSVRDILKTNPSASGGGASATAPSGGGGGAPQFNVVGNTGVNQIAETLATQEPQRAYVVSNDITSQQALDRNIVQNATLG
jgi:hypothetical protein